MSNTHPTAACGTPEHHTRRSLLKFATGAAAFGATSWLTPVATALARHNENSPATRAKSVIVLWLEGAPSQLETFDPHPDTPNAAGSKAIDTNVPGIMLGEGFQQTATQMDSLSLIRAITSKEGDHARAIYNIKTGFRADPTLVHPSIGSVICHQLNTGHDQQIDIPRHVSILPGDNPGRGGYLGDQFDAFKVPDPVVQVPDVQAQVDDARWRQRMQHLEFVDRSFLSARSSGPRQPVKQNVNLSAAKRIMSSDQLDAFDVSSVPIAQRLAYGDTAFGRGCLAAVRLIETGVRCVEVTLNGWDTHINNHELQAARISILDPALATMIEDLKRRDLFSETIVLCGGEFGRTPWLNGLGGRDHWPHGFSLAIGGGGIQGGRVVGETSGDVPENAADPKRFLKDANPVENIHATILSALGIDFHHELQTPIGRPMKISEGQPIVDLL